LFWIGFTFLMPLASLLAKRFGNVVTMTVAALSGAASALAAAHADDLISLGVAHFICGGAWGAVTATTVTTAFILGRRGRAGTAAGAFFSLVAVATMMRIALLAAHGDKAPAVASALPLLPSVSWLTAALLLLPVARRVTQQRHIFASAAVPARR
jgi:MFS family permease